MEIEHRRTSTHAESQHTLSVEAHNLQLSAELEALRARHAGMEETAHALSVELEARVRTDEATRESARATLLLAEKQGTIEALEEAGMEEATLETLNPKP